jgi:hypothetical protein
VDGISEVTIKVATSTLGEMQEQPKVLRKKNIAVLI